MLAVNTDVMGKQLLALFNVAIAEVIVAAKVIAAEYVPMTHAGHSKFPLFSQ